MGERHRLADGVGVRDLFAGGLADGSAGVDHQNPISHIDLAQVEGGQHRLLLVRDGPVGFGWSEHDGAREREIAIRFTHRVREPRRAADANDLRPSGHGAASHTKVVVLRFGHWFLSSSILMCELGRSPTVTAGGSASLRGKCGGAGRGEAE